MKGHAARHRAVALVAAATVVATAGGVTSVAASPAEAAGVCPKLYVLGVQGTGQSSSDASPTTDSGMLSAVMKPLLTMAGSLVQRAYVPYPAGFGGATAGSDMKFDESVTEAMKRTNSMIKQIADRCEDTDFALTGYSQGAFALGRVARDIGQGKGPVSADRVAGVSLFGDPTRPKASPLFPGRDGATRPDPAPGTSGASLETVPALSQPTPEGGGIGPVADSASDYGDLTGRVASHCATGDLACDAPSDAPVTHLVTNIVGQSKLDQDDPVQTLSSLAEALALTSVKTAVPLINEDVQGETLDELSYQPSQSISQRLAVASDPRTPLPSAGDALSALVKVGTIGLNAVVTVAKEVLTPATITALATTGLANPPAALAMLGAKALEATVKLVPPTTVNRWANEAFTAVKQNISDNSELLDVSNLVRYWQTAQQHGSYTSNGSTASGLSATVYTATWFAALAADLAGKTLTPSGGGDGFFAPDTSTPPSAAVVPTLPDVTTVTAGSLSSSSTTPSASPSTPPIAPSSEAAAPSSAIPESGQFSTESPDSSSAPVPAAG
ncbi:cutinase family protein [Gordonia terrae]|uniref:Cutinase family protein n=1 Tax=Gordonia rubripertincta TaxID=36822 RepID=A0AAW6RH21_GORRU|nr:cutinase family protein [Gordonia rubripertincta]MCZ4537503.1 cutinase family protein [Gordonia terrae]MDG6783006.1 cutinase family protein [Gordonia rubripertincta]